MKRKDSRMVMAIEADLKKAIFRAADKGNVTASELVRKALSKVIATKGVDENGKKGE